MEPQRLYPAWHGRSATLAARRLARLNYSRTAKTDEGYLPLPKRASTLDIERGAANLIGNYATICALIAEHAEQSIPATFTLDANRACIAWEVSFLFGHATDNGTIDSNAKRTFRRVLESLNVSGILTVDEWSSAPLIAEALAGQILSEATATSRAPNVLPTTRGHQRGLDGTVRTFRAHMPIVGDGTQRDALELTRDADVLLAMFSHDGQIGEYRLLGTQDLAGGDLNAGATARYGANGELRKACAAGHGVKSFGVDNGYNERAQLIYRGGNGRNADSIGKARHYSIRSGRKPVATFEVGCWAGWRTLNVYGMTWSDKRYTGHMCELRTSQVSKPSTRVGRKRGVKQTPEVIAATECANAAHERAMALYNAHVSQVRTDSQTQDPCPTPRRFKFATDNGTTITVGLKARGYDVVIVESDGTRHRTSTSAPEYVEAIVRNRLALIG